MKHALLILALALALGGCTAAQVATAGVTALKIRDLSCGGARVVARLSDRVCRGAGGPWVVPRSEAERSEDSASRLLAVEPTE